MAHLKIDRKQSGNYLRIIESARQGNKVVKRDLYSLGKIEDFRPDELAAIGKKLLQLSGYNVEQIEGFQQMHNVGHYNYGYQNSRKSKTLKRTNARNEGRSRKDKTAAGYGGKKISIFVKRNPMKVKHKPLRTNVQRGKQQTFTVLIEQDEDGFYIATVPSLKSCYTQAKTLEELYPRVKEVIALCLKEEKPIKTKFIGVQQIEIAA